MVIFTEYEYDIPGTNYTIVIDTYCQRRIIVDALVDTVPYIIDEVKEVYLKYGDPENITPKIVPFWTGELARSLRMFLVDTGSSVSLRVDYGVPYGELVDKGDPNYRFGKYSFESIEKLKEWVKEKYRAYHIYKRLFCPDNDEECLDDLATYWAFHIIHIHEKHGFPGQEFTKPLFKITFREKSHVISDTIRRYLSDRSKECIRVVRSG